ncbi:MAG: caspase family protein [Candidatus Heimdallarchaeum endolithica]|uniref:Caspase family protein n=1 Tax=Candidatus Heimdallarchaeum endolithica TaxID=2876572 RepID=A0A9Y1FPT1_9ARCH|nr:MAG: caspase family protein [Candidatus Heimdallarchaeum endolithica]
MIEEFFFGHNNNKLEGIIMKKRILITSIFIFAFLVAVIPLTANANVLSTKGTKDLGGGDAYNAYSASNYATLISTPISGYGDIYYSSDQYDQYKVAVSSGDKVTIEFTAPSGATGIDLPVYDTDKSRILIRYNIQTFSETVTASGNGYIYFTIDADRTADRGTYYLSVSKSGAADTTPPTVSITDPADGATVYSADVTVSWTGSDNVGIDHYNVRIDSGSWTNVGTATSHTFTGLSDGSHTVDVNAYDAAGNVGSDSVTFTVDTSAPPTEYTFTGSLSAGQDSTQHTFNVPSNTIKIEVQLQMPSGADYDLSLWDSNGARTGGWTNSDHSTKTNIANSDYSGYSANPEWINVDPPTVFGTWKTGCYAYSGSGTYTITVTLTLSGPDTAAPTVTITAPTDGSTVNSADVTVTWTGSDNVGIDHYEVRIDSGSWTNVGTATSHTFTGLSDGSHTVDVNAYDAAGNVGSDSVTFTVDTTTNPVEKWAVIVGISDYKAISDLSYCDEDATDWYYQLTSSQMSYDHVTVLGDGHSSNYPQYDGYATEYNVKQALNNMVNSADSNDIIAFISSGHGSGNGGGSSYLCMWDCSSGENGEDGNLYDTELAAILDGAVADRIFVFLDHCYSGGFGDNLMNMPNKAHVYLTTTCTENGYGYDDSTHHNGAWTYYFLDYSWQQHFGGAANVAMEDIFDYALAAYPYSGGDTPQEFDGNTGAYFYLA